MIGRPGYLTADQIREMAESGYVRFGLHTHTHPYLTDLDEAGIRAEMQASRDAFYALLGTDPTTMAYPGGKHSAAVRSICDDYIDIAYTTAWPTKTPDFDRLSIPRFTIDRDASLSLFRTVLGIK